MSFSRISGQERAVSSLRAALTRGQLHHAYLFGGPDGVGKELCAVTLAQAANCEKLTDDACGACPSCKRIAKRNHADVLFIVPEAEQVSRGWAGRSDFDLTPSRDIKIAQIRKLQDRLSLRALEARRKFAIICEAQQLNPQAQNALLKTLEEPPQDTTIVLVSSAPNALLPTIRSRCLKLSFGPLPLDFIAQKVMQEKKADASAARLCAALSGGSLAAALDFDPKALAARDALIAAIEGLPEKDGRGAIHFAAEFGDDRAAAEIALELLVAWYRDVAAISSGMPAESLANRDLAELAQKSAQRLTVPEILRRIELCSEVRGTLRGNANPRLQVEQLVLRFLFPSA